MNNDENLVFNEGNSINIETNNPNVTIRRVVMRKKGILIKIFLIMMLKSLLL